jgi:subtilisin family serine protease
MLYLTVCAFFLAFFSVDATCPLLRVSDPVESEFVIVLKSNTQATNDTMARQAEAAITLDEHLATMSSKFASLPSFRRVGQNTTIPAFSVDYQYSDIVGFLAYSATMSPQALELLMEEESVDYIEENQVFSISQTCRSQTSATWGIVRTSVRTRTTSTTYRFPDRSESGIFAYVLDTGIRRSHTEFQGRATWGWSAFSNPHRTDRQGHGTHCAGTVGGRLFGVAKSVRLVDVQVLGDDGRGSTSGIIGGINWVASQTRSRGRTSVANLSLGGGRSSGLDDAVNNAVNSNVLIVSASGNENQDACNVSPARAARSLTVNAATSSDIRSSFSNWGSCTHVFAPGSSITSASHMSDTGSTRMSGTSMAAPHVAGIAVKYLAMNPTQSAWSLRSQVINSARTGLISDVRGSPNRNGHFPAC